MKKAITTLRKTGDKEIKKTLGKKGKEMSIKGSAKKTLEGAGKASAGGVGAFDLEAFFKVKFSKLEKTAHQKKVRANSFFFHNKLSKLEMRWQSPDLKLSPTD